MMRNESRERGARRRRGVALPTVLMIMVVRVGVLLLGHLHDEFFTLWCGNSYCEVAHRRLFEAAKIFAMFLSVLARLLWISSRNIP